MAFKQIEANGNRFAEYFPKKASERKAGDNVVGAYKGTREITRPDGSTDVLYVLEGKDGLIGVNTSPVIATKMEQVAEGMTVKIQYEGKERSAKTGREYNNFSVWVDEDDSAAADDKKDDSKTAIPF